MSFIKHSTIFSAKLTKKQTELLNEFFDYIRDEKYNNLCKREGADSHTLESLGRAAINVLNDLEKIERKEELIKLKSLIGQRAFTYLRRGGYLHCWTRSTPWNWWIETKKYEHLWHVGEDRRKPDLSMFELVEESDKKIGDGLPQAARAVISREWRLSEYSLYKLKEEYRSL